MKIPHDKPYIVLKGKGKKSTEVVWDDHETVAQSPTFTCLADNVVIKGISFRVSVHKFIRSSELFFFLGQPAHFPVDSSPPFIIIDGSLQ